ncbi:MAG: mechanosensitive ion channel family protein [Oscillospiraceae bacterium]|nr:mechanosensitive ion channel family protein [Oscillospiraceae bacterium]
MERLLELLGVERTTVLWTILRVASTVLVAALLIALVNAVTRRLIRNRGISGRNQNYVRLARYALLIAIYAVAIATLVTSSAEKTMSAVLASSGILAVVLSIACQEPIGNLASGVLIMLSRPFSIGDMVRYIDEDIMGVVEEITLRHTVIRTFENKRLIVPNSIMNKSAVENSNYGDKKLNVPLDFNITYESDLEEAMRIIVDVVLLHPHYHDYRTSAEIVSGTNPVDVYVREFRESSINVRAWIWAISTGESVAMKSDILIETRRRFMAAGIEFAYPHVTVVKRNDGGKP